MVSKVISIKEEVKSTLDSLKLVEEETYNGVIKRLIISHNTLHEPQQPTSPQLDESKIAYREEY